MNHTHPFHTFSRNDFYDKTYLQRLRNDVQRVEKNNSVKRNETSQTVNHAAKTPRESTMILPCIQQPLQRGKTLSREKSNLLLKASLQKKVPFPKIGLSELPSLSVTKKPVTPVMVSRKTPVPPCGKSRLSRKDKHLSKQSKTASTTTRSTQHDSGANIFMGYDRLVISPSISVYSGKADSVLGEEAMLTITGERITPHGSPRASPSFSTMKITASFSPIRMNHSPQQSPYISPRQSPYHSPHQSPLPQRRSPMHSPLPVHHQMSSHPSPITCQKLPSHSPVPSHHRRPSYHSPATMHNHLSCHSPHRALQPTPNAMQQCHQGYSPMPPHTPYMSPHTPHMPPHTPHMPPHTPHMHYHNHYGHAGMQSPYPSYHPNTFHHPTPETFHSQQKADHRPVYHLHGSHTPLAPHPPHTPGFRPTNLPRRSPAPPVRRHRNSRRMSYNGPPSRPIVPQQTPTSINTWQKQPTVDYTSVSHPLPLQSDHLSHQTGHSKSISPGNVILERMSPLTRQATFLRDIGTQTPAGQAKKPKGGKSSKTNSDEKQPQFLNKREQPLDNRSNATITMKTVTKLNPLDKASEQEQATYSRESTIHIDFSIDSLRAEQLISSLTNMPSRSEKNQMADELAALLSVPAADESRSVDSRRSSIVEIPEIRMICATPDELNPKINTNSI